MLYWLEDNEENRALSLKDFIIKAVTNGNSSRPNGDIEEGCIYIIDRDIDSLVVSGVVREIKEAFPDERNIDVRISHTDEDLPHVVLIGNNRNYTVNIEKLGTDDDKAVAYALIQEVGSDAVYSYINNIFERHWHVIFLRYNKHRKKHSDAFFKDLLQSQPTEIPYFIKKTLVEVFYVNYESVYGLYEYNLSEKSL